MTLLPNKNLIKKEPGLFGDYAMSEASQVVAEPVVTTDDKPATCERPTPAVDDWMVLDLCQDEVNDNDAIQTWLDRIESYDGLLGASAQVKIERAIDQAGARQILV